MSLLLQMAAISVERRYYYYYCGRKYLANKSSHTAVKQTKFNWGTLNMFNIIKTLRMRITTGQSQQ